MARRVIALRGPSAGQSEDWAAAEAITPGMLVARNSSNLLIKHNDDAPAMNIARDFAMERDEMGKDIDTNYAIGDTVKVGHFTPGDRVNAIIASGVNAAANSILESAGDGTLRVRTSGPGIAVALEAVNNSAGPGNVRLRVELT